MLWKSSTLCRDAEGAHKDRSRSAKPESWTYWINTFNGIEKQLSPQGQVPVICSQQASFKHRLKWKVIFFYSWKVSTVRLKADLMSHFLSWLKMFSDLENHMKSWPNHCSLIFLNSRYRILGCVNRASLTRDYLQHHGANAFGRARGNLINWMFSTPPAQ